MISSVSADSDVFHTQVTHFALLRIVAATARPFLARPLSDMKVSNTVQENAVTRHKSALAEGFVERCQRHLGGVYRGHKVWFG